MSNKFFVYKGGRWVELLPNGKLLGERRKTKFLYVKNGTLKVANRGRVCRALQRLARGERGRARKGATLYEKPPKSPKPKPLACCCHCRGGDALENRYPPSKPVTEVLQPRQANVNRIASPLRVENEKPVITRPLDAKPAPSSRELLVSEEEMSLIRDVLTQSGGPLHCDGHRFDTDMDYRARVLHVVQPVVKVPRRDLALVAFAGRLGLTATHDMTNNSNKENMNKRPKRNRERAIQPAASAREMVDKKSDKDRRMDETSSSSETKDLFDSVLKSDKDRRMDKVKGASERKDLFDSLQKKDKDRRIARSAGARQTETSTRHGSKTRSAHPSSSTAELRKRKAPQKANAYSTAEDLSIVQWVSSQRAERKVNGNRVWRALQGHYGALTGKSRSYQSLRNRYLRYILPRLGALGLAPHTQARLRAAANIGEIKRRRVSLPVRPPHPPTVSAWSRRPQRGRTALSTSSDGSTYQPEPVIVRRHDDDSSHSSDSSGHSDDRDSVTHLDNRPVTLTRKSPRVSIHPIQLDKPPTSLPKGERPRRKLYNPKAL